MPIGDLLAGMYGAYGAVAALHERNTTGRGRVVRTSLLAAIVGVHAFQGTRYTVAGEVPRAQGNHHPSLAPYGAFTCKDAILQIAVGSEGLWRAFAPIVGLDPADERFSRNALRVAHRQDLIELVNAAFADRNVDELLAVLAEAGVPAGEVRTLDRVYGWEQTRSQGLLLDVEHPTLGQITLPGPPLRFDDAARCPAGATSTSPRRPWASTTTASARGSPKTGTDRHGATGTAVGSRASSTCRCGASVRCEHRRAGEVRCG